MVNKALFSTGAPAVPVADTKNDAGGKAYSFDKRHALAQIAATNCFNGTYYAGAEDNLKLAKDAVQALKDDPEFIAKVAIYSRDKGYMKDMPAYLTAVLAGLDTKLFRQVFRQVINNGKMLRNVIQIARSGQTGKKINVSSGTWRHAIQEWFDTHDPKFIFGASIGNDPTMRDILRMAHVKPRTSNGAYCPHKEALFAYMLGAKFEGPVMTSGKRSHSVDNLPEIVRQYEAYKADKTLPVPAVDFRFLDHLVDDAGWKTIAENASWTMTRMNLNTFARHGVFNDVKMIAKIADRLQDRDAILKAKAFPYQLLMAYTAAGSDVPPLIKDALQEAMEVATDNAPVFQGSIQIAVDTSGSMGSPVTGHRGSVTTNVRCVDVAALFAATVIRKNRLAGVLPFDTRVHLVDVNGRDSIMTNATKLARQGGGTNCACALEHLNANNVKADGVVFISDYESWVDTAGAYSSQGTGMMSAWATFKRRNPKARLVCIDLTPRSNTQVAPKEDILQVGGFSDHVFEVVSNFLEHGHSADHWVDVISSVALNG